MLVEFPLWRREHAEHHADVRSEGFRYDYARLTGKRELLVHIFMLRHFARALMRLPHNSAMLAYPGLTIALSFVAHSPAWFWLWLLPLAISAVVHTHIELPEHLGTDESGNDAFANAWIVRASRFATWFVNANNYHALHHHDPRLPQQSLSTAAVTHRTRERYVTTYMDFFRKFYAGILAATFVLCALGIASASDIGSRRSVREVRAAIPVLVPTAIVDGVTIDHDQATVAIHYGKHRGTASLSYHQARWWLVQATSRWSPEYYLTHDQPGILNADGYLATWHSADAWSGSYENILSRAPSDAEMVGVDANSIYFFELRVGAKTVTAPKSTLTVWCPFVLDTQSHYSMTFAGGGVDVGHIDGTLKDNTLTFALPAFTAQPSQTVQGEIEVNPTPR